MTKLISLILCICFIAQFPQAIRANTNSYVFIADNDTRVETRVYLRSQCLLSENEPIDQSSPQFVGALLGIFIPLLIEKALGAASGALKKAGSPKTLKDFGRRPTYLYRISNEGGGNMKYELNPDNNCVIVVRGTFSGPDELKNFAQSTVDFSDGTGIFLEDNEEHERKRVRRLQLSKIPVKTIAAVYEAKINLSDDRTAMNYESRFLEVRCFQGNEDKCSRGKRSSDKRALVVSLSFYGAGSKEGEPTLSLALVNLGQVNEGTFLGPEQLRQQQSTWLGGIGINDASLKAIEKMNVEIGKPQGLMPVTVEGMFAETSKGNDALLFIAEILDATKGDVAKTISGEILKDREKEAATAAEALEKLRVDEETAYIAYLKAADNLEKICSSIPPENPPQNPLFKYTQAQKVLLAERDRTYRAWSLKHGVLKKYGATPTDSRPAAQFTCANESPNYN